MFLIRKLRSMDTETRFYIETQIWQLSGYQDTETTRIRLYYLNI